MSKLVYSFSGHFPFPTTHTLEIDRWFHVKWMSHRCSIIKESRQSWSWPWAVEVLGMFGHHHVYHNVPLGSKVIEDSHVCGQIFWWNGWIKVKPLLVWMEDLGEEVVIDTETKCISTKDDSDLYYTRSCGRAYGPVTADRDAVDIFLNSKHTCFQIPSKSYTTGWIGSCLCDLSRRHIKSPCAAKVVLSTVESTHGISVHSGLYSLTNPLESPLYGWGKRGPW